MVEEIIRCPNCWSTDIRRSMRRTVFDNLVCNDCRSALIGVCVASGWNRQRLRGGPSIQASSVSGVASETPPRIA